MEHLRVFVKRLADAMSTVFAHHRIALCLDETLNRMADVAECGIRFDNGNAEHHRLLGHGN